MHSNRGSVGDGVVVILVGDGGCGCDFLRVR